MAGLWTAFKGTSTFQVEEAGNKQERKKRRRNKKQLLQQGWAQGATVLLGVESKRIRYQVRDIVPGHVKRR